MSIRKTVARLAGAGAAATIAMGLFSAGAANADTFVPLPGGEITKTLSDGTVVTIRMVGESATISPSMGSTPVHRNAWVSGSAQVELSGTGGDVGGAIFPGYVVGCQVNIAGGGVDGGVEGSLDWSGETVTGGAGASSGGNLSLGPGQATSFYVLDLEQADDYGSESHKKRNKFKGSSGSVTWADSTIGLSGCGGYAQARSFVSVEVETDNVISWVTLWGQPFSLG
ncbi:MspA family porin [Nocardia puris]|uniref:MspA protein n=1 Tax=Nocardia puris TaxID=208602 RepID=A0A366D4T1_9NOCA|nr:MspA family porin [Nocardia puris]MBF6214802.1 MspA family porin [Nocardia puris]MBF6364189.1 MspA family porin [Nocardia puris]MBF6459118.1 MspA family porin [Nocardia puris]RBO84529.1 MspA protein [Nocardia puris]